MKISVKIQLVFFVLFLTGITGYAQNSGYRGSQVKSARVLVYFFHGTHRCSGCINAEKATVLVLNRLYAKQQKDGTLRFESLNIEEPQNKAIAQKYQVAWNMLLFVPVKNEKKKADLTEQAFSYSNNSGKLEYYIKNAIDPMLK